MFVYIAVLEMLVPIFALYSDISRFMLDLHVQDETAPLKTVILGTADRNGPTPSPDEAYDPKSLEHILKGTYPTEQNMCTEIEGFRHTLERHGVDVLQPRVVPGLNQIFTRDIGFVIEDRFFKGNILPDRADEWEAINHIIEQIPRDHVVIPPDDVHIEGGDVMLWGGRIFVGTYENADYAEQKTARTNVQGVDFLKAYFPDKEVRGFDLIKSDDDARANALHLDFCFQPVGKDKAIVYGGGFRREEDFAYLKKLFGPKNLFQINADEMYHMYSNVFSISPDVVVSERRFVRLNNWLEQQGFVVERIAYHEIGKQEGLLRCSTLPLVRH